MTETDGEELAEPASGPAVRPVGREGWLALAIGGGLGAALCWFGPTRFVLSYLAILIHEVGHSLTALLFGYFSVPAFNFTYGGGVALTDLDHRYWLLPTLVGFGLCWTMWVNRRHRAGLAVLAAAAGAYLLLALTPAHQLLILAMGHGAELIFAALFLYRALSGSAAANPAERPAYALAGTFLTLNAAQFAWRLLTDPVEKIMYEEALATGGNPNDFVVIAVDAHCGIDPLLAAFLAACALPPVAAVFYHRYHQFIFAEERADSP